MTITIALPASSAIVRIRKSCSEMASLASKTITATSQRSIAACVRNEA